VTPLPRFGDALVHDPVELGLFFVIGLFGTSHCLGMCGPLVSVYSERLAERSETAGANGTTGSRGNSNPNGPALTTGLVAQHALFNFGRLTIYATLGGLFGLLGGSVFRTADVVVVFGTELRGAVGIATGAVVVATGTAHAFGRSSGVLSGEVPMLATVTARIRDRLVSELDQWLGGYRTFVLGFVHGFLPCPLLYPAFLYAFATGDPVGGALALAALGAGTFPAVFLYGTLYQAANPRRYAVVYRLVGAAFVLLGANTLLVGASLLGVDVPYLFAAPIYQPLGSPGVSQIPILVALPVATLGSLLLVGVGAMSLYRRRSVSYLLVTLALAAFTTQILASTLTYVNLLSAATYRALDYVSNAVTVLLILGAIYYVSERRDADEPESRDDRASEIRDAGREHETRSVSEPEPRDADHNPETDEMTQR
jgi:hypothetical protein